MIFIIVVQLGCFLFTICAHAEDCIGQQCSQVISIPLLDNMKADLDVAELNKVLQKYIQQEVRKAVKGTFVDKMEGAVKQIIDNVTRPIQSNMNATIERFQDCQWSHRETTPAFSSVRTHDESVSQQILLTSLTKLSSTFKTATTHQQVFSLHLVMEYITFHLPS
ncbi:unnamed protein product [Mytilus coruscus]|uniref:Uncharacterized protein n=1 Tax=Mytilus coruscus TaxID=42192 RepID=A0A6J8AQ42_MYTCO|nr:unnamed protein product [Mytilus coruscus]